MRYLLSGDRLGAGRWWGLRSSGPTDQSPTLGPWLSDGETRPAGVFITLEGPEGSGKSSLLPTRAAAARAAGCDVVATRSPARPVGEQVRRLVLDTEPDDRPDRPRRRPPVRAVAGPARRRGDPPGARARRGRRLRPLRGLVARLPGRRSGVPMDELRAVQRFATGGLVPDLTILLDLPVEAGLARKAAEVTRFEAYHDLAYHERVRAAFLALRRGRAGALRDRRRDARGRVLAAALAAVSPRSTARRAWPHGLRGPGGCAMNRCGLRCACHDERVARPTRRLPGRLDGSDRRGRSWPGWPTARSTRWTPCTTDTAMAYRNRPPHHRRRRPRGGRRPGRLPRRVAQRRSLRRGPGQRARPGCCRSSTTGPSTPSAAAGPTTELPAEQEGSRRPTPLDLPDVWAEVPAGLDRDAVRDAPWPRCPTSSARRSSSPTWRPDADRDRGADRRAARAR